MNKQNNDVTDGTIAVTLRDRKFTVIASKDMLPFDVVELLDQLQEKGVGQGQLAKALLGEDQWQEMKEMQPKPTLADLESILNQAMVFLSQSAEPSDS